MAQTQNYEKAHGLRKVFKILMVIIFVLIGAALITLGAICIAKGYDKSPDYSIRWLSICNIVFGCLLFTSPFFLNQKREGLNKVIKILMVIIFVVLGIALIVMNSICLAKGWTVYTPTEVGSQPVSIKWLEITNLVLGCLLLTSPYFLKK